MSDLFEVLSSLRNVQLTEGILGLLGNVLVCLTIMRTKKLQNITNCMLFNLAAVDATVSLFNILEPTLGDNLGKRIAVWRYCTPSKIYYFSAYFVFRYFLNASFANSVLALTLATFERYIGIIKPLHYKAFFTKGRVLFMVAFTWLFPFLTELHSPLFYIATYKADNCSIPTRVEHPSVMVSGILRLILIYIIPCIALGFMYIKILMNLKRGARDLVTRGVQGPSQELQRAYKKVTQSLALVIAAFFILMVPGQVILRNITIHTNLFDGSYSKVQLFNKCNSLLIALNSSINPILYGFKYSQLRRACIDMLCSPFSHCQRSNQVGMAVQDKMVENASQILELDIRTANH